MSQSEDESSQPQPMEEEAPAIEQPPTKKARRGKKTKPSTDSVEQVSQPDAPDTKVSRRKSSPPSKASADIPEASNGEKEVAKTNGKAKGANRKGEAAVKHFIDSVLPALRKEMVKQKKEVFKLSDHAHVFEPNSTIKPTYLLPLFHYLGKNEVHCDRYREFDYKHMVHTKDGFEHCMKINKYTTGLDLTEAELSYMMKRFGKEWHKIPAKDKVRVAAAMRAGATGEFKVILSGIYYDSFFDDKGVEIHIAVPILNYEGIRAKEPPAPKAPKKSKKRSREEEVEVEENPQEGVVSEEIKPPEISE